MTLSGLNRDMSEHRRDTRNTVTTRATTLPRHACPFRPFPNISDDFGLTFFTLRLISNHIAAARVSARLPGLVHSKEELLQT